VISAWLSAHRDLDPSGEHEQARRQALADLEKTYERITQAETIAAREHNESSLSLIARTVLLLDSRPPSAVARTVMILYYVSLAWVVLWVAAAFLFGLGVAVTDPSGSFGERLAFSFGITVLCLAVGLAPALLLFLLYRMSTGRFST
jgi:hypothetical protein